jgi:hypothetical protein
MADQEEVGIFGSGGKGREPPEYSANQCIFSSLRANGSRECAPDDRLREAIHASAQRKNGLLRRKRSLAQTLRVCRRQ